MPHYERFRDAKNYSTAAALRDASVAGDLRDTLQLFHSITKAAQESQQHGPKLVALWFSRCPLGNAIGCTTDSATSMKARSGPLEFPHWLDEAFVASLQQRAAVELVLAEYGNLPEPPPLLTNLCEPFCAWPGRLGKSASHNCSSDGARHWLFAAGLRGERTSNSMVPLTMSLDRKGLSSPSMLCPQQCASVDSNSQTYPTAQGHMLAARKLSHVLSRA